MSYVPLRIAGNATGLVQNREEFLLPDDAYPVLENAYVWRERIRRKQGYEQLGRLQRLFTDASIGTSSASPWTFNLFTLLSINISNAMTAEYQPDAQFNPGSVIIIVGAVTFTDQGDGTLTSSTPGNSGVINYQTGSVTLTTTATIGTATTITLGYFPSLPVMGLRNRDVNSTNAQLTIAFDTTYAYIFSGTGWREYLPGTTWTGDDTDFFWHTNYSPTASTIKLTWVTNFSGSSGDPTRYTDGTGWTDFTPTINVAGDVVAQCRCILPFRSRLLMFNTYEGADLASSLNYPQRIRWSAEGNPLASNAWRDDPGQQGGFLPIPTNEEIVSVGFVRDNIVIYCSRSTWQLRYSGRNVSPFDLEKINSELGAEATFSAIQFDQTLVGIGDKGIVECDSFKSNRIDIKIPDLVFNFNDNTLPGDAQSGTERIQSVRDFVNRLAFWTYPTQEGMPYTNIYPNRRLVYNYENDSWAIFTDSLTALGTFITTSGRTWASTNTGSWQEYNFPWISRATSTPDIIGGNQQGWVLYLDAQVSNDPSLIITAITGHTTTPTVITSPNHNLVNDQVIKITGVTSTGYANLNDGIFGVDIIDANTFALYLYDADTQEFSTPQLDAPATYNGGGQMAIRDGFYIQSKKFNYIDQGKSIQIGYIDLLTVATDVGAFTLNVLTNYNETNPVNTKPLNADPVTSDPDTFFNSIITTSNPNANGVVGTKYFQRVFCATRANFITLVYTLSNAQLVGEEQESDVQIDAQTIWNRPAGRMTNQ